MPPTSQRVSGSNIRALMEFLRHYAPFSHMEAAHLALFVETSELHYFADGEVVIRPEDGPAERFFVVKQGRIRGERPSARDQQSRTGVEPKEEPGIEITFEITQGECFPLAALIGERPTRTLHRAVGDTFCLSLDRKMFVQLFTISDVFRDYCLRGVSSLLDQVNRSIRQQAQQTVGDEASLDTPLSRYALRNPVVCSPDTPVQKAVLRMHEANVGSIIITDDHRHPVGIFTLRDLRALIAGNAALDAPIQTVMTQRPLCLSPDDTTFDAALVMAAHHFAHVCLINPERELVGVVSERDLFALQKVSLVHLTRTIATAPELHTLVALREDIQQLVDSMLARGAAARQILRVITSLNDCTVKRVIELNLARHDPGVAFTWLSFGSEARQEQTLYTDQDNAILFAVPEGMTPAAMREKLLPFAKRVNEDLAACGFTLCKGNIMASNPELCLSLGEWEDWYRHFTEAWTPQNLVHSAIFLDARAIFGDVAMADELFAHVRTRISGHSLFLRMMAEMSLERRPPLNFFQGFVYAKGGDKNTIDLKLQGLTPFVDAARVLAYSKDIAATNTFDRLEALQAAGVLTAPDVNAWIEAYSLLHLLRMRHHQERRAANEPLDNRLKPETLNPLDARILRESFRQAQRLQQVLALTWQL